MGISCGFCLNADLCIQICHTSDVQKNKLVINHLLFLSLKSKIYPENTRLTTLLVHKRKFITITMTCLKLDN